MYHTSLKNSLQFNDFYEYQKKIQNHTYTPENNNNGKKHSENIEGGYIHDNVKNAPE